MDQRLHVVTCISNPVRYESRYRLYREFADYVEKSGAILHTIELALGDRPHEILEAEVKLRSYHELWHKENLLNIMIQRLPADWKYVAWVDADVRFARPDWVVETVHELQHYMVVQMFSHAQDLGPRFELLGKLVSGFIHAFYNDQPTWNPKYRAVTHPGFAWAARREAIDAVGGLIDWAILGAADLHMAAALTGQPLLGMPKGLHSNYYNACQEWASRAERHIKRDVGYVSDWGSSIQQRIPVLPLVWEKFQITLLLTAASASFAFAVGVAAGIVSAVRQNSWVDRTIMVGSVFALSMPPYWLGLIGIFVFSVQLHWLPTGGMYSFDGERSTADALAHLVMPAIVAGLTPAAIICRVTRSAMLEIMRLEFMTALRAKGLPERAVILRHAFRNALPTVVSMTGLQIGYLILGAALFVEIIFSWPGMGLEIYKAVVGRDMPMMMGLVLFSTIVFVLLNLVVDVTYRFLNPRVREI